MEYEQYAANFFVQPAPEPRFEFTGLFGTTLFYEDYEAAVAYFTAVFGPPAYVEGAGTRGWPSVTSPQGTPLLIISPLPENP